MEPEVLVKLSFLMGGVKTTLYQGWINWNAVGALFSHNTVKSLCCCYRFTCRHSLAEFIF